MMRGDHLFFLGIGGIGMSALARHAHCSGFQVSGYDRERTRVTAGLEALGIPCFFDIEQLEVLSKIDHVIYTPAIKKDQREFQLFDLQKKPLIKRSEALQYLLEGFRVIAVAGTHGKTTTSALLAHILTITGKSVSCFVGGVMKGYDSNYISGTSDWVVVEADEYDRSFLKLNPEVVVIQAMDADHLDIYGSHDMMLQAYRELTLRIRPAGTLWIESTTAHDYLTYDWKTELSDREVQIRTFGIDSGDVRAEDVTVYNDSTRFKVFGEPNYTFSLTIPGDYNIRNALASIGVASSFDLRYGEMASALSSFEGLERRYEKVGSGDDWVLISDYAHHPIELRSVIRATRELYPNQHLTVVFEPHLYTRTRDFLNEFALELGRADTVILVELYPAREKPIVGIDSQVLLDQIDMISKRLVSKNDIVDALSASSDGVILLLGAGDLYKYQGDILDRLEERDKSMR